MAAREAATKLATVKKEAGEMVSPKQCPWQPARLQPVKVSVDLGGGMTDLFNTPHLCSLMRDADNAGLPW